MDKAKETFNIFIPQKNDSDQTRHAKNIFLLLLFLFIFLIILTFVLTFSTNVFSSNGFYMGFSIFFILFFGILLSSFLVIQFYTLYTKVESPLKGKLLQNVFLFLIGFFISGILLLGIIYLGYYLSSSTNDIVQIILNISILLVMVMLVYKLLSFIPIPSSILKLIFNIIFYIPCLFTSTLENVFDDKIYLVFILIEILLVVIYFLYPLMFSKYYLKNGKQLINNPVRLYEENTLATTQTLNDSDDRNYQYAISFWFYLDSVPPSVNNTYTNFGNILSLGKNPSIRYKSANNEMYISVNTDVNDIHSERIVCQISDILLQKWNHVIINYSGGTMDVFYNGKLFESAIEVVPYQTFDTLIVGQENGISGGLSNLIYYKKPLNIFEIHYLYNSMKNKNPPSLSYSNKTIIPIS